ncbi:MAG: histidine triad nucleotide-binding protein [Deltaproteobacteria bacterium]|nr:histidine triad nucleotide-binding protein [Deltaproteobacteria bacterium]
MTEEITVFDRIKSKEIPAKIIYEDEVVLAFQDINPQAPVHVLVIPQNKIVGFPDILDLDQKDLGAFLQGVARVAKQLGLEAQGYRVIFNYGKNGQQTVEYVHAHILGGRQMKWPPG